MTRIRGSQDARQRVRRIRAVTALSTRQMTSNDTATTEIYTLSLHYVSDLGGRRIIRSEERRVGKEGRSRWSPYHLKKTAYTDPTALTERPPEHGQHTPASPPSPT